MKLIQGRCYSICPLVTKLNLKTYNAATEVLLRFPKHCSFSNAAVTFHYGVFTMTNNLLLSTYYAAQIQ